MTDITTSRNISTIVPVSHFGGITPLCVPMTPDSSFSEEVSERFSKRVSSLWERLGLVFFTEEQQPPAANDGQLVVNNFSSQIIFQLFGNKNTRRLVVKDQPGFVYLDNICKQHESRQKLISERISREMTERISSTDRLAQQVKSLYNALGDEKAECSSQLLVITLERLLKESAEHKSVTETEVVLLKRLQRTLRSSESVYETKLLERLSKVKDGQDITVDSRAEILSAISDYSADIRDSGLQRRAAELIMSAASESGSVEDVRKKLTQTIDRLHKVVYDESGIAGNGRMALLSYGPEEAATQNADRKPGVATVSPAVQQYDITRSVTELLQSAADEASADKTLTAEQRIVSSYSGKSVEEIDKRIRRVYESIAVKDRSHSGQVISAANNVILSLISRRSAPVPVKHRAEGIVTQELITPVSQITTNEHGSNMGVLPTLTEPAAAPSAYFADLSSGVEQVYAVTDDVQSVSYRDIKKAVSQLMSSRTARNSVSAPLNRVLHNTNVTVNDIAINNENNHSDTAYNAYSGNIYRSQSTKLSEGQDIHHEHKFIDGTEMILNVQQGNVSNVNNVTTSGTVLPAEQNNYTLNRSGDMYYAENRQEGAVNNISGAQVNNITNTQRTVQKGDNVRNVSNVNNVTTNGTVLPAEQNNYTLNRSGDVYYTENRQEGAVNNISGAQVNNITNAQHTVQQGDSISNVSNVNNVTTSGTVLPAEQNNYTLNRSGDVYYAENRQEGAVNNISGAQVNNITNTQHTVQQGDSISNVNNVTTSGTVLPAEQNNYTFNRSGDVYYAENRQEGAVNNISGAQVNNITNTQHTVQQGDNIRNVSNVNNVTTNGTVLPAEQSNYTLNRSGDVYYAENRQEAEKSGAQAAAAGSYRSRLDSKTLAALDEMIQSAGIRTNVRNTADEITDRYTVKEKPSDTVYEYVTTESQAADSVQTSSGRTRRRSVGGQQPDRMQINQLRTAAIMRRGVGITPANGSTLISSLVDRASRDAELTHKGGAVNSSFSYRTIDSGENMVMLIPPTEMDRYQAESGYAKQMPPIDLKQKPEPEQQSQLQKKKKTAINVKEEPVTVKTIGSIEGMSREEISKLVDKVYEQLEVKLLRERRRRGL